MKYFVIAFACAVLAGFSACGGSSDTIKSLQISPQQGQATAPKGVANFTATGTFANSQSRLLTSQDGLMWSSSDTAVATINSLTGQATCLGAGSAVITGSVPNDLTYQGGAHSSSTNVSGTAGLQCIVSG
ncbi:MAG: hypothetical protein WAM71_05700 [Candidatus Korobacteraceae bacterium]